MVQMTLTPKPMLRQQIADKMGIKGDMVSRVTVGNRLNAHGLRFNKRLKKLTLRKSPLKVTKYGKINTLVVMFE